MKPISELKWRSHELKMRIIDIDDQIKGLEAEIDVLYRESEEFNHCFSLLSEFRRRGKTFDQMRLDSKRAILIDFREIRKEYADKKAEIDMEILKRRSEDSNTN